MKFRLREILKERSLTLKAFSEMSGISQPNLSNYINGNISPSLEMLMRIARCLKIRITDLFGEEDDDPIEKESTEQDRIEVLVRYKGELITITEEDIIRLIAEKKK